MCTWYSMSVGDALLADDQISHLKTCFSNFELEGAQVDASALFLRYETKAHLYCEGIVYFSPATHPFALSMDAHPCAQPNPQGLALLAGPEASREVLFESR
jgi:hypothetical protein